jgi:hypothetical protein
MEKIETEILIEASPNKVWELLMDFPGYPEWNPFIKSISGSAAVGGQITVRIEPPDSGGMSFKPRVLKNDPVYEFRWKGKLLFPGLFDGEHYFLLHSVSDRSTRLIHGEIFSGILPPLLKSTLRKTAQGFEMMNLALKMKAEKESKQ